MKKVTVFRVAFSALLLLLAVAAGRSTEANAKINIDLSEQIQANFFTVDDASGEVDCYYNCPEIVCRINSLKNQDGDIYAATGGEYSNIDFYLEVDWSKNGQDWQWDDCADWDFKVPYETRIEPMYSSISTISSYMENAVIVLSDYEYDRDCFKDYFQYQTKTSVLGNDESGYVWTSAPYFRARIVAVGSDGVNDQLITYGPWSEPRLLNDNSYVQEYDITRAAATISDLRQVCYNPFYDDAEAYIAFEVTTNRELMEADRYYELNYGYTVENDVYISVDGSDDYIIGYAIPSVYGGANGTVYFHDPDGQLDFSTEHTIQLIMYYYVLDDNGLEVFSAETRNNLSGTIGPNQYNYNTVTMDLTKSEYSYLAPIAEASEVQNSYGTGDTNGTVHNGEGNSIFDNFSFPEWENEDDKQNDDGGQEDMSDLGGLMSVVGCFICGFVIIALIVALILIISASKKKKATKAVINNVTSGAGGIGSGISEEAVQTAGAIAVVAAAGAIANATGNIETAGGHQHRDVSERMSQYHGVSGSKPAATQETPTYYSAQPVGTAAPQPASAPVYTAPAQAASPLPPTPGYTVAQLEAMSYPQRMSLGYNDSVLEALRVAEAAKAAAAATAAAVTEAPAQAPVEEAASVEEAATAAIEETITEAVETVAPAASETPKFCPECGVAVEPGSTSCAVCGYKF